MNASYSEYRQGILDAFDSCQARASFQHLSIPHPLKGPSGEPLFTDIFYSAPVTSDPGADGGGGKTFVHQTGVHGAEGYLGSLVQQRLFREVLKGVGALPFQIILIHAVNPYGMAWFRRTNHENVDLNRNSHSGSIPNPHFPEFLPLLRSKTIGAVALEALKVLPKFLGLGINGVVSAVAAGQTYDASSVFYGGKDYQIELANMFAALQKIIPSENKLAVIDVHTGLGSLGDESLLIDGPDAQRESVFFSRVFEKACGPVSGVAYDTEGCIGLSYKRHWYTEFVTQEFGTKPFYKVLWNLMNGSRDDMRETFFPDDEWWRGVCTDAGLLRFRQILSGF